jgi:undecaprenyl diphosphate synthase
MTELSAAAPRHIAFIMDGNGRWAKARGLPRLEGHRRGVETVKNILRKSDELGVEFVTLYAFSTENWNRPAEEVNGIMNLIEMLARDQRSEFIKKQTRLRVIGELERLPKPTRDELQKTMEATQSFSRRTLVLALSYSGRDEMVRAVNKLLAQGKPVGSWEDISGALDTAGIPDPDLIIRTSGEMRLSNFLMLQGAYSELFFTPTAWPDFSGEQLEKILASFGQRQRRFGRTGDQVAKTA